MISIVTPAYNEAGNLPQAIAAVEALFKGPLRSYALEIIVTDNCSTDNTWKVAQDLAATRPNFKAYRFARNFGYQNSVFTGLCMATGDAVVELDADLEDPPPVIVERSVPADLRTVPALLSWPCAPSHQRKSPSPPKSKTPPS